MVISNDKSAFEQVRVVAFPTALKVRVFGNFGGEVTQNLLRAIQSHAKLSPKR